MSDRLTTNGFAASGFFVLRTPLLPFDELVTWGDGLEAAGSKDDPVRLEQALAADRARLRRQLVAAVGRPEVREALFVASPSLDEVLDLWLREPASPRGERAERAIVRYFARMAGRATPFGLFAGCSVGTFGEKTVFRLSPRDANRRHTRLDMDYLFALAQAVGRDPAHRGAFVYRPNSSLYEAAGRIRYVEARVEGTRRSHHLVAVEASPELKATLAKARDGATFEALAAALVDEDVTRADAGQYVGELIDAQMLVCDVAVPVTGREPVDVLVEELGVHASTRPIADRLVETRAILAEMDGAGVAVPPERYRAAARGLESLPTKVELARLFQVDLVKPAPGATLGPAVLDEITAGVKTLQRLARPSRRDALLHFREAFVDRYEEREVALVEALDEEGGIGFGSAVETSPLLKGLEFPRVAEDAPEWTARETLLLRMLSHALTQGWGEITLEPRDLDQLAAKEPAPLPGAFAVTAAVAVRSEAALAAGEFRVLLDGVQGPSGARLLGRFCHADASLRKHVEAHLQAEEAREPEALFAEIVHLPEGRLGNILFRPLLRSHEIPYLGRSGAPVDRQLPVTDLVVSVARGEIILRSASLKRRIVPRLTTAHNFRSGTLGLYRFLCAVQGQGVAGLGWDWGPLRNAPFLPRISTGRLVLSRAQWHLDKAELRRLGEGTGAGQFQAVQAWRAERRLPRWITLADGDNTLPVDLDNVLSIESFVHLVKEREEATLQEPFPGVDELLARGPEGRFVHELIVPFVRAAETPRHSASEIASPRRRTPAVPAPMIRRSFPPGSEWLFVKLYAGVAGADQMLRETVAPVVHEAVDRGLADRWFFIRYADPQPHLRVRFHGAPDALLGGLWPLLRAAAAPLLDDGRIRRLTLETYEREVERYGGPAGIELAEQVFHADSDAVLEIVELLDPGDLGLEERWRLALHGLHLLLKDLGFDLCTQSSIVREATTAFGLEFRADRALDHQVGEQFRKERASLSQLLEPADGSDNPLGPGLEVLRQRSERLRPVLAELGFCEAAGRLSVPRTELARSYLHMHANRLLRSLQRQQEFVLYDFLSREYESRKARRASPGDPTASRPI